MILSQLRNDVKYDCPEVVDAWPTSALTDTNIDSHLNRAALEIAYLTCCIPDDHTEELTVDTETFALESDFLVMDEEGVLYLDSNSKWQVLEATTMKWLDKNKAGWRTADSSDPEYFFWRGNNIHIYPESDTTRANGLLYYFGIKPTEMTSDSVEPFNELPWLDPFHPLVTLRVKIDAKRAKTKFGDARTLQDEYMIRIQEMNNFIHGRALRYHSPDFITKVKGYMTHFKR